LGEAEARKLIAAADQIRIAKGSKLEAFTGQDEAGQFVSSMLGSTGNLRAPTIVVGSMLVVGFNEEVYREVFGVG
jgi:arsenate reductase-like glutaredoxin family protein